MASEPEWRTVLLRDLAAPVKNALVGGPFGSDLVSADYVPTGVPVIRGENLSHGRWVGGDFAFVSEEKAKRLAANTAGPLDIVFTQRGANHYRQVGVVRADAKQRYVISQSQMKLTVDPRQADPLFVYYMFRAPNQQEYLKTNAIQTGVPHTNLSILKNVPLRVPALPVQRAVAETLGYLDSRIELFHESGTTLESIAQALFKSWFVDFDPVRAKAEGREPEGMDAATAALFPSEFEESELGLIPKGWRIDEIGKAAPCVGGATPSTREPRFWDDPVHHWVTPKDLSGLQSPVLIDTERRVSEAGLAKISSGLLPVDTLLLSSRAPIGYLAIAHVPTAINQGFIAMLPGGQLPASYLLFWTKLNMDVIKQKANGSTFMEISKSAFRPIRLVVPPSQVIAEFDSICKPMLHRIAENEKKKRHLADIRDTLLPRLISGKLRLPQAEAVVETLA